MTSTLFDLLALSATALLAELATVPGHADVKTVRGTVVVEGTVPQTGWIELLIDNMHGTERVPVHEGRWSVTITSWLEVVCVGRMELDGRDAHHPMSLPWIDDGYRIEARWTPVVTLRAVDAGTGRDIREVELVCGDARLFPAFPREGRRRTHSPTEVPVWEAGGNELWTGWRPTHVWWVRAEGYAWARVVVDNATDREQVVELHPGGSVRVRLSGTGRKWTAAIHVIRAGAPSPRSAWPVWHPEEVQDLEGLPPGDYLLQVWGARLLAQATVSVAAGAVASIGLDVGP